MASHPWSRWTCALLLAGAALLGRAAVAGTAAEKHEGAVAAARAWLALVDDGRYEESWAAAAELFQNAVPKGQWAQQVEGVRKPLGAVAKRELRSQVYRQRLPGAPDGHYVVIQFDTSFAHKKGAVETVTPMLDHDGTWRVSGYYIR